MQPGAGADRLTPTTSANETTRRPDSHEERVASPRALIYNRTLVSIDLKQLLKLDE